MKPSAVRLFLKPHCPWCHEAVQWFETRGIPHEKLYLTQDAAARREMFALTAQTLTPSVDVDGHILADFDTDELEVWWKKMGFDA